MTNALKFKHTQLPKQPNELARIKVVQGPDYGATYVVTGKVATVGRGDECDVMLTDLKSSRHHAEIALTANGWTIRDAGSANGIQLNGNASKGGPIKSGDTFVIGETTLEFFAAEAGTSLLVAPPKSDLQIKEQQQALALQRQKIQGLGRPAAPVPGSRPGSGLLKDKRVLLGAVALVAGFLLFGNDPSPKPKPQRPKSNDADRDLASYLTPPSADLAAIDKQADIFFKDGFREFRQGNYLRAKVQFDTVLQMAPGHQLARIYSENCDKAIQDEIKNHLINGKKSLDAGKLKEAKAHFESVERLLYVNPRDPSYVEADSQLKEVMKQMAEEEY